MSGIYIPGMEMPRKTGSVSIILSGDGSALLCEDGVYSDIAVVPVPPHGRLIDADALPWDDPIHSVRLHGGEQWISAYKIATAPTIIPADKEEQI